ncbi:hypothetical protein B0O99DRAFT_513296 [Bisporella sp. PMI_857]|nr:hypothetical protein B0O99DRAFT_513296 [Bisporella sp. PMI_857]
MTTTSTPATPGPSTPTATRIIPLDQLKAGCSSSYIIPPARPSSTPFPQQEHLEVGIQSVPRESTWNWRTEETSDGGGPDLMPDSVEQEPQESPLFGLPLEIQERILDYLVGFRKPVTSNTARSKDTKALRNWGNELRHSRRREVSELALVSKKWRPLVQDRLYRHIKIKATRESVDQATMWFTQNQHLCPYVKHVELWFPVFQQKPLDSRTVRIPTITNLSALTHTPVQMLEPGIALPYQSPNNNCTLEEALRFVQMTFPEACVLSLEGGDRKKPPMVRHYRVRPLCNLKLPSLPMITTLVCKGQWNIMREDMDFHNIMTALPNLIEWHGVYARPKSKSYLCMATIFPKIPRHITHLNITMENEFRRESQCPEFFRKVAAKTHFCRDMAKAMPALEHFGYTGRICHCFFDDAAGLSSPRYSRLKSIEISVKNLCRPPLQWTESSGITDMSFIYAFEALVHSAVRSLHRLSSLRYIKIKYIDLDFVIPAWSPYFLFKDNTCLGMWNDDIIESLATVRPGARWLECVEAPKSFDPLSWSDPSTLTRYRGKSLKVTSYLSLNLNGSITIN